MNNLLSNRLINWTDGMKINKSHFISSDNYHIQQSNISRQLFVNETSFGLLPVDAQRDAFPNLKLIVSNGQVTVSRFAFSLVMLNGSFFMLRSDEIDDNAIDPSDLKLSFKIDTDRKTEYALIIKTRPYERIGIGAFESEGMPLRRPLALEGFSLSLQTVKQTQKAWFGSDFFVISRFSIEDSILQMDEDYIPPSSTMLAHPLLKDIQSQLYNHIIDLETLVVTTLSKFKTKKSNDFNETLIYISSNLLISLSRIKIEIKHKTLYQPPVYLVCLIKELANIMYQSMSVRGNMGKDIFLEAMNKILSNSKEDFGDLLNDVVSKEYRHYDISGVFSGLMHFIKALLKIYDHLSETDKSRKKTILTIK